LIKLSGIPLALMLCGSVFAQPSNDDCGNATIVDSSAPDPVYTDSVDATDATFDPNDPLTSCNGGGPGDGNQTVWWEYTPDADGLVSINTFGSTESGGGELDTSHAVYTGSCGLEMVEVGCADFGLNDQVVLEVQAGVTYRIKVGQYADANDAGTVVLNVEPPPPPRQFVLESYANGTTRPIRDVVADWEASLAPAASSSQSGNKGDPLSTNVREIANYMKPDSASDTGDAIVGSEVPDSGDVTWRGPAELLQVFEGAVNDDNWNKLGTLIAPPDTIGDVGPNHYIQQVNLLTEIFDKEGNSVLGPFPTSLFFESIFATSVCPYADDGDPIVIYDEESDRWLVSQFHLTFWYSICVAVSATNDPLGEYHAYEFDFILPNFIGFPDYPKYGMATGSVNAMFNIFAPFQGAAIGAIDKEEMWSGIPATMVLFLPGISEFGFVPGDNDGPVFDNTLPTFFTNNGGSGDTIDVWEMVPDWDTPEDSTMAEVANIAVSPWDSNLCGAPRGACVPQPGVGTTEGGNPDLPAGTQVIAALEGIADRLMHRGQTRDFGQHKVAMLSHTVDADGTGKAGVRWYELENKKDRGWKLKKEETFSPDDDYRWMGSIAMTAAGDTCLGYSISSESTYPSIGITGRKGTADHMNIEEAVAVDGNVDGGVQRGVARWGDYSSMNIDPVDDSCWYTQEMPRPNEALIPSGPYQGIPFGEYFGWGTHVIQFRVDPRSK
jgi:hypothetical protein